MVRALAGELQRWRRRNEPELQTIEERRRKYAHAMHRGRHSPAPANSFHLLCSRPGGIAGARDGQQQQLAVADAHDDRQRVTLGGALLRAVPRICECDHP